MRWLLIILFFLCGCGFQGNIIGYQNTEPTDIVSSTEQIRVPMVVHVRSLRDMWVTIPTQIKNLNERLASHGFLVDRVIYVADSNRMMLRVQDRKKLFKHSRQMAKAIHVVIVLGIYSITEDTRFTAGLFVRSSQNECHEYIALSDIVRPGTLTHEVGHLLGLNHVSDLNNIMSVGRRKKEAGFSSEQIDIAIQNARAHARKCW